MNNKIVIINVHGLFKFSTATQPEQRRNYFQFIGNAYARHGLAAVQIVVSMACQSNGFGYFYALTPNILKVNTFSISSISFITRVTSQLNILKSWQRLREMPPRTDLQHAIPNVISCGIGGLWSDWRR